MRKIVKISTIICILLLTTLFSGCTGNKAPNAIIQVDQDSGYAPLTVHFTGSGTDTDGSIKSYLWNFGEGSTSNEQNPSHTYINVGSFVVTLTITDNGGLTGSITKTISVSIANIPPIARLSASPTNGPAPLTVEFTGSGTDTDGTIKSYYWFFGDGSDSNEQNPKHIFRNKGTYTVTLTVTDNNNAADTNSLTIIVQEVINKPPTASASANPNTGHPPLTVQFTGSGSDTDGYILYYYWSFGDGSYSDQQSPSHTYTALGNYTATLTVTDDDGKTGTKSITITVQNKPPTASASANPNTGYAPLTVLFTGSGTDTDGWIVSYQWDFGDSTTSTQQNPSHTYTIKRSYTATLAVTDNDGKTGTSSITITVTTSPIPIDIKYKSQRQLPLVTNGVTITTDGTNYYVVDETKKWVYQLDSNYNYTGNYIDYSKFNNTVIIATGITYQDGYLYMVGKESHYLQWWSYLYKIRTNGILVMSKCIRSYITDAVSIDSDSNYLYICDKSSPYHIGYFKISNMSFIKFTSNSHNPYGFAIAESSGWYFVISFGGDVNRIYCCSMDGTNIWSKSFDPYNNDITIIGNTLVRINGKNLYMYDITY